jgi:hypothetical protein
MEEVIVFGAECRKSRTLEVKGFLKSTPEEDWARMLLLVLESLRLRILSLQVCLKCIKDLCNL